MLSTNAYREPEHSSLIIPTHSEGLGFEPWVFMAPQTLCISKNGLWQPEKGWCGGEDTVLRRKRMRPEPGLVQRWWLRDRRSEEEWGVEDGTLTTGWVA